MSLEQAEDVVRNIRRRFKEKGKKDDEASFGDIKDILEEISAKLDNKPEPDLSGKSKKQAFEEKIAEEERIDVEEIAEERRRNEKKTSDERLQNSRPFKEIQSDIQSALVNPDEEERKRLLANLMKERKVLTDSGNAMGMFETARTAMNGERDKYFKYRAGLMEGEEKEEYERDQKDNVLNIRISNWEQEARGTSGWNPKMEGMLGAYVEAEQRRAKWAWQVAKGGQYGGKIKEDLDALSLERLYGQDVVEEAKQWKEQADEIRRVREEEERKKPTNGQGLGSDEHAQLLREIRDRTVTGNEMVRAQKIASAAEQKEIYPLAVRNMVAIPSMELGFPEFLKDVWFDYILTANGITLNNQREVREEEQRRERLKLEWKGIGKISSACANKLDGDKPLHPNIEAQSVSNKEFDALNSKEGVFEAISLYTVFLIGDENGKRGQNSKKDIENINLNNFLLGNRPPENEEEREIWDKMKKDCPENIFDKSLKNKDQFEALRDSVAYWLCVNKDMMWEEAQEASINAWNMIYLANLPEWSSSKYVHKNPNKRKLNVGVPLLFTTRVWETIRSQDRFEGKLKTDEAWGPLGAWGVKQKNKLRIIGKFKTPDVLPDQTMPSAFHDATCSNYTYKERGKTYEHNLIDIYHWYGTQLINDPSISYEPPKLSTRKEGVYSNYQFDYVDYAQDLTGYMKKGMRQSPEEFTRLINVYEKLGFDKRTRELLTMAITKGVNSSSREIKPAAGWIEYGGWKSIIKKQYPGLFK